MQSHTCSCFRPWSGPTFSWLLRCALHFWEGNLRISIGPKSQYDRVGENQLILWLRDSCSKVFLKTLCLLELFIQGFNAAEKALPRYQLLSHCSSSIQKMSVIVSYLTQLTTSLLILGGVTMDNVHRFSALIELRQPVIRRQVLLSAQANFP